MATLGKFSTADFKKLQKKLNKVKPPDTQMFVDSCAKELAARLLAKVIKRTPVGDYSQEVTVTAQKDGKKHKKGEQYTKRVNPSGKLGGTLRRGWTSKTMEDAQKGGAKVDAKAYADSLAIKHDGKMLSIEIVNPVEYASYVEFGHRQTPGRYVPELGKTLKAGWVNGQFMMTISEQEVRDIAPAVLEKRIAEYLKGVMT